MSLFRHAGILALCALSPGLLLAGNLSFLKDTPLAEFSDADVAAHRAAALEVLEDPDPRAARAWRNPDSGHSGNIESLGNFVASNGLHCRKLKLSTQAKGVENTSMLPLCKSSEGEWFVASGLKLNKG